MQSEKQLSWTSTTSYAKRWHNANARVYTVKTLV